MPTKPFSPAGVNLDLGTPVTVPSGSMSVRMKRVAYYNSSRLAVGSTYSVTIEWGKWAVEQGYAEDLSGILPYQDSPAGLSATETAAVQALVSADGNLQYPATTTAAFTALAAAGGLLVNAIYNVDGALKIATSTSAYVSFSGASAIGAAAALTTSTGDFAFTGGAYRFAVDYNGVWFPLVANMPGFQGARAVVNWAVNSDTPSTPTAWSTVNDTNGAQSTVSDTYPDGAAVYALQNVNPGVTGYGPYVYGPQAYWSGTLTAQQPARGLIPSGTIFAARVAVKWVSGGTGLNLYHRNLDNSFAPTESGNGSYTIPTDGAYRVISSTFQQCTDYDGFGLRVHPYPSAIQTVNQCRPMLEDLSGEKGALTPSEYVPASTTPGWRWFDTQKAVTRTNATLAADAAALLGQKNPANTNGVIGEVTDATGSALASIAGLVIEPAATNLHPAVNVPISISASNTIGGIGQGKISGAMTGAASGVAGARSGNTTLYWEAPSHMLVSASDIATAVTTNIVSSSTTNFLLAGFNTSDTYWIHCVTGSTVFGPLKFTGIGANSMTSTVALTTVAAGSAVRIMRVPASGDQILIELNDGTWHATTTAGAVTLPAGAWDAKAPITVTLTAAPSADASYASSDNGRRLYWYAGTGADFGFTVAGGTATFRVISDRAALVAAGLGYISPNGLVFQLAAGTSAATFDFGGASGGTASRNTKLSVYARKVAGGASAATIQLKSHGSAASFTGTTSYERSTWTAASVNTDTRATISCAANATVYVVAMQMEQAASGETAVLSSPIVVRGAAATRTATRAQRAWNGSVRNGITRRFTWTPAQGALAQKQTLWALYVDASNYLELSITNTTVTWRKRRGGTNFDVTASYTPVAGTPVEFLAAISSTAGITLSVGGIAATPNTNDLADITALTPAAIEDIGSAQGSNTAYGAFKALALA